MSKIAGTVPVPEEYIEYRMCKLFHCLPSQLDEMDEDTLVLYSDFIRIEAEAATIGAIPTSN